MRENARTALANLLTLVDDDDNIPLDPELDAFVDKVERVTKQGKALMQSGLRKNIQNAVPAVDIFVDTVDNIVQVSDYRVPSATSPSDFQQAHPLLNVGWQLVATVYKVDSP